MIHITETISVFAQILVRAIGMSAVRLAEVALATLLTTLGAGSLAMLAASLIQVSRKR